jgi:hypothetical protein
MARKRTHIGGDEPNKPTPIPKKAPPPSIDSLKSLLTDAADTIRQAHQTLVDAENEADTLGDALPDYHRTTLAAVRKRLWLHAGEVTALIPGATPIV